MNSSLHCFQCELYWPLSYPRNCVVCGNLVTGSVARPMPPHEAAALSNAQKKRADRERTFDEFERYYAEREVARLHKDIDSFTGQPTVLDSQCSQSDK